MLGAEEKRRAARFRFPVHRRRFVVRRAIRRVLLGELTDAEPAGLQFVESADGKPRLAAAATDLEFSSSHSEEWGVIATHTGRVGVDIEMLSRPVEHLRFAEHHFTADEFDEIRRYEADDLRRVFFNCWTGKEAYVKALGHGLRKPLKSFAVECRPDVGPGLRFDSDGSDETAEWKFERFSDGEAVTTVAASVAFTAPTLRMLAADTIQERTVVEREIGDRWEKS